MLGKVLLAIPLLILSLFSSDDSNARDANGSGTLHLHETVMRAYEDFKRKFNPAYFAVSTNGLAHGYSFCPDQACQASDSRGLALTSCQRANRQIEEEANIRLGGECFIFASAGSIVWDGDVIVLNKDDYVAWLRRSGLVQAR